MSTFCGRPIRDRTHEYNVINITLGGVTASLVLLRTIFRVWFSPLPLGADDHFLNLAFITALPSTVMNVHGLVDNGLGLDVWTLTRAQITRFALFFYVMQIMYFTHLPLLKTSMLLFFLRIFPDRVCRRVLWCTVAVNAAGGAAFLLVAVFQCRPVQYAWLQWRGSEYEGSCVGVNAMGWAHAGFNILLDLWMLGVPLTQVKRLHMHWKKKLGVALMFVVGTFVTVISIMRLWSLIGYANSENPTYDQWEVAMWSTVEINVGIMCVCMPALRGLLVRIAPRVFDYGGRRASDMQAMWTGRALTRRAEPEEHGEVGRWERTNLAAIEKFEKEMRSRACEDGCCESKNEGMALDEPEKEMIPMGCEDGCCEAKDKAMALSRSVTTATTTDRGDEETILAITPVVSRRD